MDYRKLELRLRRIVEKRLREGWNLRVRNSRYVEEDECAVCAIGAVVAHAASIKRHPGGAAPTLGISVENAFAISDGFESKPDGTDREYRRFYAIGERIRRLYVDTTADVVRQ